MTVWVLSLITTPSAASAAPAANTGLIVFLPLIGAILGGIIGAVGGAYANSRYRDQEVKKTEDRELNALLLLIDAEVVDHIKNIMNATDIHESPSEGQRPPVPGVFNDFVMPRTEDWDRIKER